MNLRSIKHQSSAEAPESRTSDTDGAEFAEVAVSRNRGPSIIWLIPLVALLIGGWLTYKTISEKGPTITISFNTADGLEAGKTKIKYKDVEVGQVDAIAISDDLQSVIVTASLAKDAEPHLTDQTQFWVVRPHLSLTRVSGLGTLVSGAYIAIEPGAGAPARNYTGIETPPVVRRDVQGNKYVLTTSELGSVVPGSPVYYRQIKVGEVLNYELAEDERTINVHVMVESPHHRLVREGTRFFDVSGIDVSMGADGMKVRTASLVSIIAGGIAFETPDTTAPGSPDGTVFHLYKGRDDADAPVYTQKLPYTLYFEDSVRGLSTGAPVDFRGIRVGEVTDVHIEIDSETSSIRIPVTIAIEPERVPSIDGSRQSTPEEARLAIQTLVDKGMRAQLETGSLITGQKFVSLDLHPDEPLRMASVQTAHAQLPTIDSTFDAMAHSVQHLLAKLSQLPLEQLVEEVTQTVRGVNTLVHDPQIPKTIATANGTLSSFGLLAGNVNRRVRPLAKSLIGTSNAANSAVVKLREALGAFQQGAPMRVDMLDTLEETAAAARSIRVLADYLERHPEALLSGKGG
ncbi:MAG: intermembrane transport protein PqiB [Gammaproteobacteria bacterium]